MPRRKKRIADIAAPMSRHTSKVERRKNRQQSRDRRSRVWDRHRKNLRRIPLRVLLPNAITLLALCSGMTAIRMAIHGKFELAVLALIIAMLLDGLDGLIARLVKGESSLGAQLDSLSDIVSFGVTPPLILYLWSQGSIRGLSWSIGLLFASCCALRLARFNIEHHESTDDEATPSQSKSHHFNGVPAPAAAYMALLPIYLNQVFGVMGDVFRSPWFISLNLVVISLAMVSRVPTPSLKAFGSNIDPDHAVIGLAMLVFLAALATNFPWHILLFLYLAYIIMMAMAVVHAKRARNRVAQENELATIEDQNQPPPT